MGKNRSINGMMENFRITIWNASEDEVISVRVEPFGYNAEKFEKLKALYNITADLVLKQKEEKAEWELARNIFNHASDSAIDEFKRTKDRLRHFYNESTSVARSLELYENNFGRYADFVAGAKRLYSKVLINNEVLEKMLPFNYSTEILSTLAANVDNLDRLKEERERKDGDAQYATKERNTKIDELEEACSELTRLAKLIFEDNEAQYLEKLGIKTRS